MPIEAVIFDCDGVLVDSETIAARVGLRGARALGLNYSDAEYVNRFTGLTIEAYLSGLDEDHQQAFGTRLPDGFTDQLLKDAEAEMNNALEPITGVHDAISRIDAPLAVASSSGLERLKSKLRQTHLYDIFTPHTYSGDQVENGKPAPDLFLFAANQLGVRAEGCIAIEDSVNGVRSAVAAGMRVVGFTGGGHCGADHHSFLSQAGATNVIGHMDELSDALQVSL